MDVIAEGLAFPEGPVALADGSVLVVELRAGRLTRVEMSGRKEVVAQTGGGPNGAAIGPDGAAYLCNNGGNAWVRRRGALVPHGRAPDYAGGSIQRVDLDTGQVSVLYEGCDGRRLNAPNDLVFDRHGGFWFTDHGFSDGRVIELGDLYYARADGSEIRHIRGGLITPNGVGLSPDGDWVYVAETRTSRVWGFKVESPGCLASGGEAVRRVLGPLPGDQWLDSLAVEASGRICVATVITGGISIFDPVSGAVEHVPLDDWVTTNICFSGADGRTAFVTASATGRLYRTSWPRPGAPLAHTR